MNPPITHLQQLRSAYRSVCGALPWLDATRCDDGLPAFPGFEHTLAVPGVSRATNESGEAAELVCHDPAVSPSVEDLARRLTSEDGARRPLVLLHTGVEMPRIANLAQAYPRLSLVVESGPRKILYFLAQLEELMIRCPNVFLSTYNFCNWLGLERLCERGLGKRVLFGTHGPAFDPHIAMGPIVMSRLPWRVKCDMAGNNLRRLLGRPEELPGEVPFATPPPFIIDTHGHNLTPGAESPYGFPVPDECLFVEEWTAFMDSVSIEQLITVPARALWTGRESGEDGARSLRDACPARFRYLEVFNPSLGEAQLQGLDRALDRPGCAGIKIHPSLHKTAADDDAYAPVFERACRRDKPILTHSWEISDYNPVQKLSHPLRFRRHLERFPRTRLVLGHAGGRPSTFDDVAAFRDFPSVSVDLAGDYFDNGLVPALVSALGPERVLFASDVDWIDPRCMLGAVLGSRLPDAHALLVLRENAQRVFPGSD